MTMETAERSPYPNPQARLAVQAGICLVAFVLTILLSIPLSMILSSLTEWTPWEKSPGTPEAAPPLHGVPEELSFGFLAPLEAVSRVEDFLKDCRLIVKVPPAGNWKHLYLRAAALERFQPRRFYSDLSYVNDTGTDNFDLQESIDGSGFPAELVFLQPFQPRLPYVPKLRGLQGNQAFLPAADGSIRLPLSIIPGDAFSCTFKPLLSFQDFMDVKSVDNASLYLQTAEVDDPGIRALAASATLGADSPKQKMLAIRDFLEKQYSYVRSPSLETAQSPFPVRKFLLEERQGNCQFISAGACLLMRMNGIPCRIGVGYHTDYCDKDRSTFYVNSTSGHSWPEVLTDHGWVVFDLAVPGLAQERESLTPAFALPTAASACENLKIPERFGEEKRHPARREDRGRARNAQWEKQRPHFQPRNETLEEKNTAAPPTPPPAPGGKFWGIFWRVVGVAVLLGGLRLLVWAIQDLLLPMLGKWLKRTFTKASTEEEGSGEPVATFAASLEEKRAAGPVLILEPGDVIAGFNRFSRLLGHLRGWERREQETPQEFVVRVCGELALDPKRFQLIAGTFNQALYGRKAVAGEQARAYLAAIADLFGRARGTSEQPGDVR